MTFDQCLKGLVSIVNSRCPDDVAISRAKALIDEYFSENRSNIANEKDRLAKELGDAVPDSSLKIVGILQNYLAGHIK